MLEGEERLLTGARNGDERCFEDLIRPHIATGYRLAAAMLNDPDLAEDAVQEATLRAWRGVRRLRESGRLRPWFLAIVANQCRSMRRTRWWSVLKFGVLRVDEPSPAELAGGRTDVVAALRRLSPEERAAVFLRFYEDMTSREVGIALGIPAASARSRIQRGLKRLRVDLSEVEL